MGTATRTKRYANVGELIRALGGVSLARVRLDPAPGRASVDDLIRLNAQTGRTYELVDGTLVEKVMGLAEGYIAAEIIHLLMLFVKPRRLGFVLTPDSTMQLMPNLVRAPDASFIRRARCPGGKVPNEPVPELVPDLAVEVLSRSNRPGEMRQKLKEYFLAGVTAVWFIDPDKKTARVYSAPDEFIEIASDGAIDGGDLLPGFRLPLAELFADLAEPPPRIGKKGQGKRRRA